MENQEPWEITFPAGYTLSPEIAYGGIFIARLSHGPAYRANVSGHRSNSFVNIKGRVGETEQWGPRHQQRPYRRRGEFRTRKKGHGRQR